MKILTHILVAVLTALIILLPVASKVSSLGRDGAVMELIHSARCVEKSLGDVSADLSGRLEALGALISQDIDFSMKLLVEKDTMAVAVTEAASRYMGVMGFSVLDITDGRGTILSSGHFPARAGSSAGEKFGALAERPCFVPDNIRGIETLTLQARAGFSCSGVPLYAIGGFVVDEEFLDRLSPRKGLHLLLKQGTTVIGREEIQTMTEIRENAIIINDTTWLAAPITLPSAPDREAPECILIMPETEKLSLRKLL